MIPEFVKKCVREITKGSGEAQPVRELACFLSGKNSKGGSEVVHYGRYHLITVQVKRGGECSVQ